MSNVNHIILGVFLLLKVKGHFKGHFFKGHFWTFCKNLRTFFPKIRVRVTKIFTSISVKIFFGLF